MRIAITSQGQNLDSPMDPRFGRASYFVVVDTDSGETSAYDNQVNLNAPQGAGIQAAQAVAALTVDALITGHVGPKAFRTFQAARVPVYLAPPGSVREALDAFQAGRLQAAAAANVEGHW